MLALPGSFFILFLGIGNGYIWGLPHANHGWQKNTHHGIADMTTCDTTFGHAFGSGMPESDDAQVELSRNRSHFLSNPNPSATKRHMMSPQLARIASTRVKVVD